MLDFDHRLGRLPCRNHGGRYPAGNFLGMRRSGNCDHVLNADSEHIPNNFGNTLETADLDTFGQS